MDSNEFPVRWRFAGNELDRQERQLYVQGQLVEIGPKPFEVLVMLLQHAGELVTSEELLDAVWTGRVVNDATVANVMSRIRKILGDEQQAVIRTVPKAGYRLIAPVERMAGGSRPPQLPELTPGLAVPGRDHWRLCQCLGSGGYGGDTWLAQHDKTMAQRVFKFCLDGRQLAALKREVTLSRLLQQAAGERDDYVRINEWNFDQPPYFIECDYAGLNLQRWAERRGGLDTLRIDERVELVAAVAAAVAAAHAVGVLHKDIKPANILIEDSGVTPKVRLCDFGAGQLLDAAWLKQIGITRLGFTQSIAADPSSGGTLLYMAPELLSGGIASLQSDVYALGVLLYQMAAGDLARPMAPGWESAVADELLRRDIADATHGERERRLDSAQNLVERLRTLPQRRRRAELLKQQQAQAAAAQAGLERARVRRPWLIAATGLLLAGLAASLYSAAHARHQARVAEAFADFISNDILHAADPDSAELPEITLKNAIVRALPVLGSRFGGDSLVEAAMDATLGSTLRRLSDPADALALHRRVVDIYRSRYGDGDLRTLGAELNVVTSLAFSGREAEAKDLFYRVFPELGRRLGPTDPVMLRARMMQTHMMCPAGACAEALPVFDRLIADIQAVHGSEELLRAVQAMYIESLLAQGLNDRAEPLLGRWLPEVRQAYGEKSYKALEFRGLLGELRYRQHRPAEAVAELEASVLGLTELAGPDCQRRIADQQLLAAAYEQLGRWNDALALLRDTFNAQARIGGQRQAGLYLGAELAEALDRTGRPADALTLARSSAGIAAQDLPPHSAPYLAARQIEALSLIHLGRAAEARPIVEEILRLAAQAHAGDDEMQMDLLDLQAELARADRRFPLARELASRALGISQRVYGMDSEVTLDIRSLLNSLPPTRT